MSTLTDSTVGLRIAELAPSAEEDLVQRLEQLNTIGVSLSGETDINRLLETPALRDKVLGVGGLEPFVSTPEEFAALIRAEYAKYGEVVKATGVKID